MKMNRIASVCAESWGWQYCDGRFSQEKRKAATPQDRAFRGFEMDADHEGCDLARVAGDPDADGAHMSCAFDAPTDEIPRTGTRQTNLNSVEGTFLVGVGETFDETSF